MSDTKQNTQNTHNTHNTHNTQNTRTKPSDGKARARRAAQEGNSLWVRVRARAVRTFRLIRTSSRFRHGTMATVMTAAFFVFVVLLNIVAVRLADRYAFMRVDMTEDRRYTLSDATNEIIDGIHERVEIDILATEAQCSSASSLIADEYGQIPVANEIIHRYAQRNPNISINYVDLSRTPAYVMQFPEYSDVLDYYSVVIKSTRRTRVTSFFEMLPSLTAGSTSYDSTTQSDAAAQSYTETYMTSLIKTVTMDKTPVVSFVDGLNVDGNCADFVKALQLNGYDVQVTDIRKDEFPENADIVLLAAPTTDLNQAQTEKLDRFLTEGAGNRTLLLFSSSLMPEMPRLNALLNEYGISLTQDIVYEGDPSQTISRQMSAFTAQMTEGEYTSGLLDRLHYPAVVNAVALRVLFDDKGSTGVSTVLTSSADGYVCSAQKAFDKADYSEADKDTRVLMAAASSFRSTMDGGEQRTDVIVAPDSLYAPEYFNSDIYGNLSLLMNVCNQRSGLDGSTVDIEPKSLYSVDFTADMRTLSVLNLVFGYVVPLAVLCAGAVVYFRRRRL